MFDTLICESLWDCAAHGVTSEDLLGLSRHCDVVFPWSLAYGDVPAARAELTSGLR